MENYLSQSTYITNDEYLSLKDPQFIGQTRPDNEGDIKMVYQDGGKYYYTICNPSREAKRLLQEALEARKKNFAPQFTSTQD